MTDQPTITEAISLLVAQSREVTKALFGDGSDTDALQAAMRFPMEAVALMGELVRSQEEFIDAVYNHYCPSLPEDYVDSDGLEKMIDKRLELESRIIELARGIQIKAQNEP